MTETPRTDETKWRYFSDVDAEENMEGVDIEFARTLERELSKLMAENERLRLAAKELLDRYTELINSGDCGNWDVETEPEVIEMRAALSGAGKS